MKKMIIPALAALFFCGVSNAQVAQKPTQKTTTPAVSKPTIASTSKHVSNAKSVTPMKTANKPNATKAAGIKRKHNHKGRKPVAKKQ
jgi:hypothetical protein